MNILYILMRNDLSNMNAGRAMAQASHASNQFIYNYGENADVKAWQDETKMGFGTAIVLTANQSEIMEALEKVSEQNALGTDVHFKGAMVIDPEYGYRMPTDVAHFINPEAEVSPRVVDGNQTTVYVKQMTCAYVFGDKEQLQFVLGGLKLHP